MLVVTHLQWMPAATVVALPAAHAPLVAVMLIPVYHPVPVPPVLTVLEDHAWPVVAADNYGTPIKVAVQMRAACVMEMGRVVLVSLYQVIVWCVLYPGPRF